MKNLAGLKWWYVVEGCFCVSASLSRLFVGSSMRKNRVFLCMILHALPDNCQNNIDNILLTGR